MRIRTSDTKLVKSYFAKLYTPAADSHKGQNGKVLIVGGSSLFHAASIWAAEIASSFVDMVHYTSTEENNEIMMTLKKKFRDGIVIPKSQLFEYAKEDDVVLVGPGMMRGKGKDAKYTKQVVKELIERLAEKRFVFDAGALQMMDPTWLLKLKVPAIVTPQLKEFETLFGISLQKRSQEEREDHVKKFAARYHCVIHLKAIVDIISDGSELYVIEGGNAGLTKGGTGDILAGIIASFYAKNDATTSSVVASLLIKATAEELFKSQEYWYNNRTLIGQIPRTLTRFRT